MDAREPKPSPAASRAILHVDMDAFFAAVEVLDDPSLAGKPVVVGGTPEGRGVVAAASYEARRFGIHSAMSAWQARRRCPDAIFIPPRGARYAEVSRLIFAIFQSFTPLVQALSLDEAFLDVTGSRALFGSGVEIGRRIKQRIRDEIGLTASVGVAPNKFLAKLASDLEKPGGFVVVNFDHVSAWLAQLPVSRLWGVGRVTREELARLGIHRISDLLEYPADHLQRRFGAYAATLLDMARGLDDRPVIPAAEPKSISEETTFAQDIAEQETLIRHLDDLAEEVGRRLRRKGYRARTVHLKARYADFQTVTRSLTLPASTASTVSIRDRARELLRDRLDRRGRPLRLLGVGVSSLESADEGQPEFFAQEDARHEQLDHLLDRLQDRYGRATIRRGFADKSPSFGD